MNENLPRTPPATDALAPAEEHGRYSSLSDYLRLMQRRRVLIGLITLGFIAVSLALSITQTTTYTATSQLSFRDPLADVNLFQLGSENIPELAPTQRSAINAELISRPNVTRAVSNDLDSAEVTENALEDSVSAIVNVQTNLVVVSAVWGDPEFAAEIANSYGEQVQRIGRADAVERIKQAREILEDAVKAEREASPDGSIRRSILEGNLSTVEGLLKLSQPVEIVERAEPPESPTSPLTARNTVLGGMVGFVFALIAAFVRDSLDRRLQTAADVHREFQLPVLGRVSDSALGNPGLAANGRPAMSESDFEPFRVLRTNLGYLNTGAQLRTVLVTSGLPEEGKSTVSMSLACAAAITGQRVLLVECDLHRPSLAKRTGIKAAPGLTDYLLGEAPPKAILRTIELSDPVPLGANASANGKAAATPSGKKKSAGTLVCVPAGKAVPRPAELLVGARFKDFLDKVSRAYDLVILDSSPMLSVVDPLELIPQVDAVLVCVRMTKTTRDEIRAAKAAISHLPPRPMGAVVTGLSRKGPDSYEYYYGY